jgi:hypothetical protein
LFSGKIVKHLVGITVYKEPMQLMMNTIDSLAVQKNARQTITVLVGMEEGTPDKDKVSSISYALFSKCLNTL